MESLLAWTLFCVVTDRPMKIGIDPQPYFDVADSERSYEEKLEAYEVLADKHFDRVAFEEFKAEQLSELGQATYDFMRSPDLERILDQTVADIFPAHEHGAFKAHFGGLLGHWINNHAKHYKA
ncbi:MAG: hypothetical protein R3F62_18970 [Planctomycetota bacterium]